MLSMCYTELDRSSRAKYVQFSSSLTAGIATTKRGVKCSRKISIPYTYYSEAILQPTGIFAVVCILAFYVSVCVYDQVRLYSNLRPVGLQLSADGHVLTQS